MRDRLVTIGVVAAVVAVWAIALGVLDRQSPRPGRLYEEMSPLARLERRPVLFVISQERSGQGEAGTLSARATPIAIVEPNGKLRAPLPSSLDAAERIGAERAFVSSYFRPGSVIRILRGGANAGAMRIVDSLHKEEGMPTARGAYERSDPSLDASALGDETVTLGVSDHRLGAQTTGVEPMRASDRVEAARLLRKVVAERIPKARVEETGTVRVRAVDLDRDGRRELVVWADLRVREESPRPANVACFLIAETREADDEYRVTFSHVSGLGAAGAAYTYVDQVDLTAASHDEIVVACATPEGRQYIVLRRGESGWSEGYRSPVVVK